MRIARLFPVVALAALAACHFDAGGVSHGNGADGGTDVPDGAVGSPDAPSDGSTVTPDAACLPGCVGNDAVTCSNGQPVSVSCDLGCGGTGDDAHCLAMVPSNGVPLTQLDGVTAGLDVPSGHILFAFTSDGSIDDYTISTMTLASLRTAGTGVIAGIDFSVIGGDGVFSSLDVTVPGDGFLWMQGTNPGILLSKGDVAIHGGVVVTGGCFVGNTFVRSCAGPGGGAGATSGTALATGCGPGGNGVYQMGGGQEAGAGGGAMAQDGADSGATQGNAGAGGSSTTCAGDTLVPLGGGGGGGASQQGDGGTTFNAGGGGGGALQISSLTSITVSAVNNSTAYVDASGEGGTHSATNDGGGGGGAGGGILLEAPAITLDTSGVFAGGGGGGAGVAPPVGGTTAPTNGDGVAGERQLLVAPGGNGGGAQGANGHGGSGGIGSASSTTGTAPTSGDGNRDGTGGGGGGAGRLRVNTMPSMRTENAFVVTAFYTTGNITLQ